MFGFTVGSSSDYEQFFQNCFFFSFGKTDINECASNPRLNSGTCTENVNRHSCNRKRVFLGTNCKVDQWLRLLFELFAFPELRLFKYLTSNDSSNVNGLKRIPKFKVY